VFRHAIQQKIQKDEEKKDSSSIEEMKDVRKE